MSTQPVGGKCLMSLAPTDNIWFRESRMDPQELLALTEFPGSQPSIGIVGAARYRHIPTEQASCQNI